MAASEPERTRRILTAGVLVFRWASFAWMTILNLTASQPFRHPAVAWGLLLATGLFNLWLTVGKAWDRPAILGIDLALSMTLVLMSGYVVQAGQVVAGRLFFATAYPASSALAWGAARGPWFGLAASVCLGIAGVLSRPINDVSLSRIDSNQVQSLANGLVNFLLAGVAAGVVSRVMKRSADQVRASSEEAIRARVRAARLAERESMSRSIHDSVLQSLALIHKRGRELAESETVPVDEVRRLADIAGRQQEELRSLILRDTSDGPVGSASLRDRLEAVVRGAGGPPISVSAVGPIWLPARQVEELAAAVQQALDNVKRHASAARVAVFAEANGELVTVSVRDDGTGFTYDEERLRATGKVGMLKSMKGRVEDLGGRMRVESAPGRGTEVEFVVPIEAGEDHP